MPALLTFDIFGTVLDWRTGLEQAASALGRPLREGDFDRVVDRQGELERRAFRSYRSIAAQSFSAVLGWDATFADRTASTLGSWPLFADSASALERLRRHAPLAATTNSDLAHRAQVEAQLLAPMDHWLCAEELGLYKPDRRVWEAARARWGVPFGRDWWHVSAYGDYDLQVAHELGLTCVFVERPHARPGPHDHRVGDLHGLAELLDRAAPR